MGGTMGDPIRKGVDLQKQNCLMSAHPVELGKVIFFFNGGTFGSASPYVDFLFISCVLG